LENNQVLDVTERNPAKRHRASAQHGTSSCGKFSEVLVRPAGSAASLSLSFSLSLSLSHSLCLSSSRHIESERQRKRKSGAQRDTQRGRDTETKAREAMKERDRWGEGAREKEGGYRAVSTRSELSLSLYFSASLALSLYTNLAKSDGTERDGPFRGASLSSSLSPCPRLSFLSLSRSMAVCLSVSLVLTSSLFSSTWRK